MRIFSLTKAWVCHGDWWGSQYTMFSTLWLWLMLSLTLCHGNNKRHVQTSNDSNGPISLLLNNIVTTRAAQQMSVEYLINCQNSMFKNKTFPNTLYKKKSIFRSKILFFEMYFGGKSQHFNIIWYNYGLDPAKVLLKLFVIALWLSLVVQKTHEFDPKKKREMFKSITRPQTCCQKGFNWLQLFPV